MKAINERALIISFTFMAFVLGTTEYIIVGLLTEISVSLGITLATAGSLVSGFAIAYAIGTPILVTVFSRFSKKNTILTAIVLIILFNLLSSMSGSFPVLMITRILTAVLCGLAISLSISVASNVITPANRGKAISYILGGFAIANVFGVPIGTFVGQHLEWPAAFILTAVTGAVSLVLNWMYVPQQLAQKAGPLREQLRILANGRILLAFMIPVLGVGAIFCIYTYVTPILEEIMGVPSTSVSWVLLVYGLATIASNWMGGKVATGNAIGKLRVVLLIQALIYATFSLTAPVPVLGMISLIMIGSVSYMLNATSQLYLIDLAVEYSPSARDFASSLSPVAANIGIAWGAALGGVVVENAGLIHLPWVAGIVALAALGVTALSYRLKMQSEKHTSQAQS